VRVCIERCEAEGWQVVEVFSDAAIGGATGLSESKRPGMNGLLARVEAGGIDQVLADTTSRIARNQGDAHHIRDRLNYHGTRLFTLSDGEIDAIKGAIKGLLDEQQRKELAHNIKRAQRGRVAEGRSPAGLAYGYRTANRIDERGRFIRGLREIDPEKAEIVRRIFAEYASGQSVRSIAERLNVEGVPGPRGGKWKISTISGGRRRADGLLRNRLYVGELVHNRTSKLVEPLSRNVRIRSNSVDSWTVQAVPALQIVDADIWDKVQLQLKLRGQMAPSTQRRGRHLLSGLGQCGLCHSGWVRIRSGYWGCAGHRDGGGCVNNRVISDDQYESRVLRGLTEKLLDPDAVELFVREYHSEMSRRDREDANERPSIERRIAKIEGRLDRLVDALADGVGNINNVKQRLRDAYAEKLALMEHLANLEAERVVALHPNVAIEYRREVEALNRALKANNAPEIRNEVIPRIRALVDSIILAPAAVGRGVDIEVTGRLARIIELATGRKPEEAVMIKLERVKGIEPSS
jgi:site-specific DNA recombinase